MPSWTPKFTGVPPEQVGPTFDIALGYLNPDTNEVNMVGYVISPSGQGEESTDVTDEQHLIQISSPNTTDRYARFPQASQSDWTHGERQRIFTDPTMYYQSDGFVDVSTPGNLTLFPGRNATDVTPTGTYNTAPLETDGGTWYLGINTAGPNNLMYGSLGTVHFSNTCCNGHEINDMLYTPIGLIALTDQGLWSIDGGTVSTHIVNQALTMTQFAARSLAYLDDTIYYLNNTQAAAHSTLEGYTRSTNTHQVFITGIDSEPYFQAICNTGSGIFFATTSNLPFHNFFYVWSGSTADTAQRIYDVPGRVEACVEALGVVYVLVREFQPTYTSSPAWTLYSIVGTQVSVVDDARWIGDVNFASHAVSVSTFNYNASHTIPDFKGGLWSDGRFLYIAWPGLSSYRLDLINGGISQVGSADTGNINYTARRTVTMASDQFVDVYVSQGFCTIAEYFGRSTSGTLYTSFFDLGAPGKGKLFRAIRFSTFQPMTGNQAIIFGFCLDQTFNFTMMNTIQVGPQDYYVPFPAGTKGTEVQLSIELDADATEGPPVMTMMTLIGDLGRVENLTLACRRDQQGRGESGGGYDQGLTGQQLAANILNIRNIGGGRGYAYIPDPSIDPTASPPCVSQIQIDLIDYKRQGPTGFGWGYRRIDGEWDIEQDMVVSLVESFDP